MDLKPCPFCGAPGVVQETKPPQRDETYYTVGCLTRHCHCYVHGQLAAVDHTKAASIIAAWNRRADPAPETTAGATG